MKKLLFFVFLLSNLFGYGQYTLIPDVNFEQSLISLGIDSGAPDGKVLTSKVSSVTILNVANRVITDLTGLQDFIALIDLNCSGNNLTNLNISKNIALQKLDCHNTSLTNLDITKNTALTNLSCSLSKLTILDVTKNANLIYLDCSSNQITNLDVSKNTTVTFLGCSMNKLTNLDISKNTVLTNLVCGNNKLTSLDFSKNLSIVSVDCQWNQLTSLDFSKNTKLVGLHCPDNLLNELNIKNGHNVTLTYLIVGYNPKLSCIQVDNKSFADTTWQIGIPPYTSFSEDCNYKTAAPIAPPVITATGNQTYCPGTSLKIVTDVRITNDPAETGTNAIEIQIASGYVFGQDILTLANGASHPNITAAWVPIEGKLRLFSPSGIQISYADFEKAIKDVEFSNSSAIPSGTRGFSINIGFGGANYLPRNGHFYEYVASPGITWTSAEALARAKKYYGLQGYLATLTAADEAQLCGAQAPGAGWIGGSDADTEGVWKWVTGPEAGITFWIGNQFGTATPPFNYANWNPGLEPNNSNNEDYAHIRPSTSTNPGTWNDLPNPGTTGEYYPRGYIVEYGGMPGDPILQISASTSIKMSQLTVTTPTAICSGEKTTLQASSTSGTINWYDSATGGILLQTGNSLTTPILNATTTYYADNGCTARTPMIVTVNPMPILPQIALASTSPVLYCLNDTATPISATASANCTLNWYTLPIGGIASTTSPTPFTTVAGSTTYYVSQTNTASGCESPRAAIIITVNPLPTAPIVSTINYCNNETAVPLTATATANCTLNWYSDPTAGTSSTTSPTPSTASVGITKYYVSQKSNATGCEGPRAEIIVTINLLPTAPIANNIAFCTNEIATPLTATGSANCTLNWYSTPIGGVASATSPTPATAIVGTTKYYVSQTITATGCEGLRAEIIVTVNPLPIVKDIIIIQCDTDLISDGKTFFNLTVNNNLISANSANETFTYFTSLNGATNAVAADLISNELAFQNTIPTLMTVWSRITNNLTACSSVAKITLKVPATNIPPTYKIPFAPVCDDFLDTNGNNTSSNNNRDGITTFDFSSTKGTILALLPSNQTYTINYYKNESDALAELNVISDISNYRNSGYPNSQDIWIRIDSNLDNACFGLGPYLTLKVEALPLANAVIIPRQCDDNADGIFPFNTSFLEFDLLKGQNNVIVTYFDQANNPLKDANGALITSPFPANFASVSQTIKAVVTNKSPQACFDETKITFIVDDSPVAFSVPSTLTITCDDEPNPLNQDGKFPFDTSTFESTILGGQTGMVVKYYDQNNVLLPSPLPNPFITITQNITVKVENPLNTICTATTVLNFIVNPVPNINLNLDGLDNELVCSNLSTFFVILDAGITDGSPTTNYDYVWEKDGKPIGTNLPTLPVNEEGDYTVEVINKSGCSRIRTIKVTASNVAEFTVDVVDLADVNTVTVNATGPGVYEYSLDEPTSFWQDSNFFDTVPAGIHTVYVNDKNGCGTVNQKIVLVGVPKFFTPNGDGYNDYWSVKGVNETFNSKSIIYIFDRYGKLLKQWVPSLNEGWDGTFNGVPLPADDYWFTVKLQDGRETKGHFSLKR